MSESNPQSTDGSVIPVPASAEPDPPIPTSVTNPDGTMSAQFRDEYGELRTISYDVEQVRFHGDGPPEPTVHELDQLVHQAAAEAELAELEANAPAPTVIIDEAGRFHETFVDQYGDVRERVTEQEGVTRWPAPEPTVRVADTEPVLREEDPAPYDASHWVVVNPSAGHEGAGGHHDSSTTHDSADSSGAGHSSHGEDAATGGGE